jgi:cell division septation protein DedD
MKLVTLVLACVLLCPHEVSAQRNAAQEITQLDRVQNLITAGRFTEARNTLTEWETKFGSAQSDASSGDRARALYLRGMLTGDAKEAEEAYVGVVLGYPSSPSAPHALLRLGQSLVTGGDHQRAVAYLARLRSDYPGFTDRETALLWLARAQSGSGSAAAACSTAREAANATNENVRTLAELERDRVCKNVALPPAPRPQSAQPGDVTTSPTTPSAPARAYAIQTAAFRDPKSAQTVAGQLRAKGFDARVVTVEGSELHRVRFGSFASAAEAAVAGERIRDAGFAVMIVSDALKERKP